MERIGILGGTFNPVHTGHLLVAQTVRERCGLDRVALMPCHTPPHKTCGVLARVDERLAMLKLAVGDDPALEICTLETDRGGTSYAVDTMRAFRKNYPQREPYFIIGMDSLRELHLWRHVEELVTLCSFIVVERPGVDTLVRKDEIPLPAPWPERLLASMVRGRLCDVSSSEIRSRIAEGRSIRYLVPEPVRRYIEDQGLYRSKRSHEKGQPH